MKRKKKSTLLQKIEMFSRLGKTKKIYLRKKDFENFCKETYQPLNAQKLNYGSCEIVLFGENGENDQKLRYKTFSGLTRDVL